MRRVVRYNNPMQRLIAGIAYELTYKRVKNINLRVTASSVCVSAPKRVGVKAVDAFVESRAAWIESAQAKMAARELTAVCEKDKDECYALLAKACERVFPLFSGLIAQKPALKIRSMKTRWGVCHYLKNTVVLNALLAEMPEAFIEYVVAHEYAHLLHHDHQAGFHALMSRVMPDYKQRRKLGKRL